MQDYDVDRVAIDGGYSVVCYECGKEFESSRFDATFCSSTCRSRNSRRAKQLDKDIEKTKALINSLVDRMPKRGDSRVYGVLTSMRNRIDSALSIVEGEF